MKSRYYDIDRIEPLKNLLKRYLKKSGVGWMLSHRDIVMYWNEAVGEEIGECTRIRSIRNGVLHVDVESSALKLELEQFYAQQIVEAMRAKDSSLPLRSLKFHLTAISKSDDD